MGSYSITGYDITLFILLLYYVYVVYIADSTKSDSGVEWPSQGFDSEIDQSRYKRSVGDGDAQG